MTPEERAELERELAAELEALGDEQEDLQDEELLKRDGYEYVRLDLATVLRKTEELHRSDGDGDERDGSTWSRLMESVAHCETVVFGAYEQEIEELQTQLLPQMAALVAATNTNVEPETKGDEEAKLGGGGGGAAEREDPFDRGASSATVPTPPPVAVSSSVVAPVQEPELRPEQREEIFPKATADDGVHLHHVASTPSDKAPASVAVIDPVPSPSLVHRDSDRLVAQDAKDPKLAVEDSTVSDQETSQELQSDPLVHHAQELLAVESARLKAQLHAQRAQQELESLMQAMALQWETDQRQQEQARRERIQERESRVAMEREELSMRTYLETQRSVQETKEMQREDDLAQQREATLAHEQLRQSREQQQMAQEESRSWRVVRLQRETQRKEKLVEEQSRLRRWHHRVMDELVTELSRRAQRARKLEELDRRRVQRECSAMRSEELHMKRVLVQERALWESEMRHQNRLDMANEDVLVQRIQEAERNKTRARVESIQMASEDQRSCEWETLWRLRTKKLRKWLADAPRRDVRVAMVRWRALSVESGRLEREREMQRRQRRQTHAVRVLQRSVGRFVEKRRQMQSRDAYVAHTEASEAAKVVQSAFRGFHVRRKFQNALEMAKCMDLSDDSEFGEVNLDDLIQSPPELDENWGLPTMPSPRQRHVEPAVDVEEEESEEDSEEDGEEEEEEEGDEEDAREEYVSRRDVATPKRIQSPLQQQQQVSTTTSSSSSTTGGGGNLAATLWNRMRNKTLKQRHALEEKQRQLDPTYRAQKLLAKPTNTSTTTTTTTSSTNNQHHSSSATSTISWSTNTDKKKAPKVKLPSLVERLRKKTAAAR